MMGLTAAGNQFLAGAGNGNVILGDNASNRIPAHMVEFGATGANVDSTGNGTFANLTSNGNQVVTAVAGSSSTTPSSVPPQSCADTFVAVTVPSSTNASVIATPPASLNNISMTAYVGDQNGNPVTGGGTGAGVVLHFCNPSSLSIQPPSGTYAYRFF